MIIKPHKRQGKIILIFSRPTSGPDGSCTHARYADNQKYLVSLKTISPPHCFTVGRTQSSINSSPVILLTYTVPSLLCKRNLDSSLKMAWDQSLWFDANSWRAFLCCDVRRGLFLGLRTMYPAFLSLLRVLEIDTLTSCSRCISDFISEAVLVIRHAFSDHGSVSLLVVFLFLPGILLFHTSCQFLFFFKMSHTLLCLQPTRDGKVQFVVDSW